MDFKKMYFIPVLLALSVLIFLGGCTGLQFNDYEKYTEALSDHSTAESERIMEQSQSIADIASGTETDTKMEGVLLSVIAMQQISLLNPIGLDIEKPTTGYDVLRAGVNHIPFVSSTIGMYKLGEAGIKAAGDIAIGEGSTITDSLNDTEVHSTGENTTATVTQQSDKSESTAIEPAVE